MCLLIETIRIENGIPSLLDFHQERMNRSRKEIFGLKDACNLFDHLADFSLPQSGIWKCRVTYSIRIDKIEFEPYLKKSIHSLQVVDANNLKYNHKFAQRDEINILFERRKNADDILMVRNNLLTDTSYCNIALWNGANWVTPEDPLLKGVRRESLIRSGKVITSKIGLQDLNAFLSIKLFNAMISFEEATKISISSIYI